MDKWRVLRPYLYRESEIEVDHYLTCGSYVSPVRTGRIQCLSYYRIRAHTKFPVVSHAIGETTVLVVIQGIMKIDGEIVKEGDVRINPIHITGDEKNPAEFIRVVLQEEPAVGKTLTEAGELYKSEGTSIQLFQLTREAAQTLKPNSLVLVL